MMLSRLDEVTEKHTTQAGGVGGSGCKPLDDMMEEGCFKSPRHRIKLWPSVTNSPIQASIIKEAVHPHYKQIVSSHLPQAVCGHADHLGFVCPGFEIFVSEISISTPMQ